jgi:hypothetical protein
MTPTAELTPSKPIIDSIFGNAVAVDGDAVAVGQAYKNHAYVFVKPVAGWTNENETAELSPTGAVTLTSLVSQSRFEARLWWSASPRLPTPAAPPFVEPPGGWTNLTRAAKLSASGGTPNDYFGSSVFTNGNLALVGAMFAVGKRTRKAPRMFSSNRRKLGSPLRSSIKE